MLGEHLSATSRDGHTTRQLMLRHGCTRAVTPPTAFLSRRCVWRLLSLIFRCSDFAFNRETIWRGWKLEGDDDVSRKLAYDEKKVFFFTWNYSRKWTRVVERRLLLPMVNEETLQSFVYFSFFSRIRRLQNFSVRNFVQKRLGGKRFERTRFRSPVDERSRNNRDKQIIRAATTQWNNVQPRSATDESISTLFSLRKASILEKCSYL